MKTRLNIDIDSKELEAQVKDWVETKLRHIAVGSVEGVVDREYKTIITKQIEKRLKLNDNCGLGDWIKEIVDDFVIRKVRGLLYDDFYEKISGWVKDAVNDAIVKCFNEFNVEETINKSINEYIQSEAYRMAKEKLKGIFETD